MSNDITVGRELSRYTPYFSLVDTDYLSEGYYVSSITYRNEGEERVQSIHFTSPEGIDNLIYALVHAKAAARHQGDRGRYDDTYNIVRSDKDSCEATLKDGSYFCEKCGTPNPVIGIKKPRFCVKCGTFFESYDEQRGKE